MTAVKPMLAKAAPEDLSVLTYPLLVQPKFDGIRALIVDSVVQSRSGKPIPNKDIQARYGRPEYNGLDGELLVGDPRDPNAMQNTSTIVMAPDKSAYGCVFYVFDLWDEPGARYVSRLRALAGTLEELDPRHFARVRSEAAFAPGDVEKWESHFVAEGYEGAILRTDEPYKHGRSGSKGPLLKVKRFADSEAVVVGVEPFYHNANEAKRNAFGRTERSTAKSGKIAQEKLGKLICRTPEGVEFGIGTGFSMAQRESLWLLRETLPGLFAKYKHFEVGVVDAPRFPVFLGFRDPTDMGE